MDQADAGPWPRLRRLKKPLINQAACDADHRNTSQYKSVQVNPTNKKIFSHRRSVKHGTTHELPALRAVPTLANIEMRTIPEGVIKSG